MLAAEPEPDWKDSYSVDGQCYCDSTFDHGLRNMSYMTPDGMKRIETICEVIGPGPGAAGNPVYNDIQCGNGPANNAGDEDPDVCPGRVDMGSDGCLMTGPTWNLELFFGDGDTSAGDTSTDDTSTDDTSTDDTSTDDTSTDDTSTDDTSTDDTSTDDTGTDDTGTDDTGTDDTGADDTDADTSTGSESSTSDNNNSSASQSVTSLRVDIAAPAQADVRWVQISPSTDFTGDDFWQDPDGNQSAGALNNRYVELLPDTRITDSDERTSDTDWSEPGAGPLLTYAIAFPQAGRYAVAVRSYSTGTQDRGVFVGLNDNWPTQGRFIEHCGPNNTWAWTDCDGTHQAWVSVPTAGTHNLVFSAYADGFQFDQINLIRYEPSLATARTVRTGENDFLPATARADLFLLCLLVVALLLSRRKNTALL